MDSSLLNTVTFWLDGVVCLLFCMVGILVNLYAVSTLIKSKLMAIFHKLLLALVLADLFYLTFVMLCYSLVKMSDYYRDWIIVYTMPFLIPLTQMSLAASCYSMVALTVERFISVCHPFFKQRYNVKAWIFLVPVGIFVLLYSSPRFFEMKIDYFNNCTEVASINNNVNASSAGGNWTTATTISALTAADAVDDDDDWTNKAENNDSMSVVDLDDYCYDFPFVNFNDIRTNPLYVTIYVTWISLILNVIIPVVVMSVLNLSIVHQLKRCHTGPRNDENSVNPGHVSNGIRRTAANERDMKKRDAKFSRASVFMVLLFVLCNAPRVVPNVMEIWLGVAGMPDWSTILVSVNTWLRVLNSSLNFLIYLSCCRRKKRRSRSNSMAATTYSTQQLNPNNVNHHKHHSRGEGHHHHHHHHHQQQHINYTTATLV